MFGAEELSDLLCQRDIEMLAWHCFDGHPTRLIAEWHNCDRETVYRRMEKALGVLLQNGVPIFCVYRPRVKVIPVSRLRLEDGIGLEDLGEAARATPPPLQRPGSAHHARPRRYTRGD